MEAKPAGWRCASLPTLVYVGVNPDAKTDKYVFNQYGFGSHNAIAEWVQPSARVLDVGCASGYLMTHLAATRGAICWGVEPDERYAAEARAGGHRVIQADAAAALEEASGLAPFDHVIYADVLEHLADPLAVLRSTRDLLNPRGSVLISLPNIAFLKARLRALRGVWEYEESGIFDRTHLRFFTVASGQTLVREAGYSLARQVFVGPLTHRGGRWGVRVNRLRPGLLANQMIFEARPH